MEPDLVAIDENSGILHICKITTSGFMGHKKRDFHIGAVKKVSEAFSKFYLLLQDTDSLIKRLSYHYEIGKIATVECHFIVPEGTRFINSLGYRAKLFDTGIMKLDTIKLDRKSKDDQFGK